MLIVLLLQLHNLRARRCRTVTVRSRIAIIRMAMAMAPIALAAMMMRTRFDTVIQCAQVAIMRRRMITATVRIIHARVTIRIRVRHRIAAAVMMILTAAVGQLMSARINTRMTICVGQRRSIRRMRLLLRLMMMIVLHATSESGRLRYTIMLMRIVMFVTSGNAAVTASSSAMAVTDRRLESVRMLLRAFERILHSAKIVAVFDIRTANVGSVIVTVTVAVFDIRSANVLGVQAIVLMQWLFADHHAGHCRQAAATGMGMMMLMVLMMIATAIVDNISSQRDRLSDGRMLMLLDRRCRIRITATRMTA